MGITDLDPFGLNPFADALPIMDAGWLVAEAPEHTTHVGGLFLFELPPEADERGASGWIDDTIASAMQHQRLRNPFDLRLVRPHGFLGAAYSWEVDPEPDLRWHVRHLALPRPGRIRELLSLVSRLHTPPLDRHRPMWEAHLIEGLADGRIALYWRASHALLDGVAAMRVLLQAFSPDPDERDMVPPWALADDAPPPKSKLRSSQRTIAPTPAGLLGAAATTAASNFRLTSTVSQQVLRGVSRRSAVPYPAPTTVFNQRLTASRRCVAQSYDITRFRAVADAAGTTLNDVVLAVCGNAAARYLKARGELPTESLTALVPVSVRPVDGPDDGNALSATLTTLATDIDDPVKRLLRVKSSMDRAKERMGKMSRSELSTYGTLLFGPVLAGQITGTAGQIPPLFNILVSNVPGPSEDLYWNGARLDGMYPLSLLFDGYGLNITQTSYRGSFEFGITADRRAIPHVQRLIDDIEDALAELEVALGTV